MGLHMDGCVHEDVLLRNMLFTNDGEPFGYLIDFFCRKAEADTLMYSPSYNTQGIPERHCDAMANMPEHDVQLGSLARRIVLWDTSSLGLLPREGLCASVSSVRGMCRAAWTQCRVHWMCLQHGLS